MLWKEFSHSLTVLLFRFNLYEEFGTSYQYDANGNVISTANIVNQSTQSTYDSNYNLTSKTSPKNNKTQFKYDGKNNLWYSQSAENVINSFTYDSYGNPLTSRVGDVVPVDNGS